jgi:hypothetical protein
MGPVARRLCVRSAYRTPWLPGLQPHRYPSRMSCVLGRTLDQCNGRHFCVSASTIPGSHCHVLGAWDACRAGLPCFLSSFTDPPRPLLPSKRLRADQISPSPKPPNPLEARSRETTLTNTSWALAIWPWPALFALVRTLAVCRAAGGAPVAPPEVRLVRREICSGYPDSLLWNNSKHRGAHVASHAVVLFYRREKNGI